MVYLITYDLNRPGQNYDSLYQAIKALGSSWWHYLDSTWLVNTELNAKQITQRLTKCLDKSDRLLVIKTTRAYDGWLKKEAWEWIHQHSADNPF
ncbi:hypothetical protein TAMA11512_13100 [Selenomonas sp. TAMA-11512]|uniref:hypothetical protein n=1 Tax=Selenomonas sp. TAMA-11512 TaxID=3095337 RepID=UPI003090DEC0|nr:hypothetical protein TAMA11512_13100 [Selenomonas sp. TAMA-11512]